MGVDHLGNLGLGFRGEASGKVGLSGLGGLGIDGGTVNYRVQGTGFKQFSPERMKASTC